MKDIALDSEVGIEFGGMADSKNRPGKQYKKFLVGIVDDTFGESPLPPSNSSTSDHEIHPAGTFGRRASLGISVTYFQGRQPHHTHKFVIDSNTHDTVCLGCGKLQGAKDVRPNKYRAKRTEYNGIHYDSQREAQYAAELDLLVKAKQITSWERQFPVRIEIDGVPILTHKVDFRLLMPDGSYELHEVKGFATEDWKIRRTLLELVWLPKHLDHSYHVIR